MFVIQPFRRCSWALALVLALVIAPAAARDDADVAADPDVVHGEGYLAVHPDQAWRIHGIAALRDGRNEEAIVFLRRAARHADKPAQALLGSIYWEGRAGVPADKALAYVWMDLAAERGYRDFLLTREHYWDAMDAAERERALKEGVAIHDEYADAIAQPRLNRILRRARNEMTGSRVGFVGALRVRPVRGQGLDEISGSQYYDARHWDAKQYWKAQDALWSPAPQGHVEVGAPRPLATPAQAPRQ